MIDSNMVYECVAYDDGFETKDGVRLHKCLFISENKADWLEKYYKEDQLPKIGEKYQVEFALFHGKTSLKLTLLG